jgi:hypothetical protein
LFAVLADLFAAARRVFEGGVLVDLTDGVRAALPEDVFADFVLGDFALEDFLGDFLRVFLDIRLPFVAFGGSTIENCGACPGEPELSRLLGKSDGLGVWLQGIRRTTRPLADCVHWAG